MDQLSQFNLNLQNYALTAVQKAAERERLRIARDLHDISGHVFTNLLALMDAVVSSGCKDSNSLIETLTVARRLAQEGLRETRTAFRALRDTVKEPEQGMSAVYKLVSAFREATGIETDFSFGNLPESFNNAIDTTLYRTVQEALTNAIRHGHANKVSIKFWIHQRDLILNIQDNGIGASSLKTGNGLSGMQERISSLRGTFRAGDAPEGGFLITICVPLVNENGGLLRADMKEIP